MTCKARSARQIYLVQSALGQLQLCYDSASLRPTQPLALGASHPLDITASRKRSHMAFLGSSFVWE